MAAFPGGDPLDVLIELQLAGVWTDVTADARLDNQANIEHGRADEGPKTDPTKTGLSFNNRLGKYSPRNPLSPLYGIIGRNTPARVSVRDTVSWLSCRGGYATAGASTPDVAALGITSAIDVRFDATLKRWATRGVSDSVELAGKGALAGDQRSWALMMRDGRIHWEWSTDGTAGTVTEIQSTVKPVIPSTNRLAVRVTMATAGGGLWAEVKFYTAPDITATWTLLETQITGLTSIFDSTGPLRVGDSYGDLGFLSPYGEIHGLEVRSSVGGTVVASPRFDALAAGTTTWSDSATRVWTVAAGSEITNRRIRGSLEISAWPSRWDVSGKDVWVPVEAAGIGRRLGAGQSPLNTPLHRSLTDVTSGAGLAAFWQCADGDGATQAASQLPGAPPMLATGAVTFVEGGPVGGDGRAASIGAGGGTLTGDVVGMTASACSLVTFWVDIPATIGANGIALEYQSPSSTVRRVVVFVPGTANDDANALLGRLGIEATLADGSTTAASLAIGSDLRGTGPRMIGLVDYLGSGNHHQDVYLDGTLSNSFLFALGATINPITRVRAGSLPTFLSPGPTSADGTISGISVSALPGSWTSGQRDTEVLRIHTAGNGYVGELPGGRIERLCAEVGIPVSVTHVTTAQSPLGVQRAATLPDLLQEAADSDVGILAEQREQLGLSFRDRYYRITDKPVATIPYTDLAPPMEPTEDDQALRNDCTVTRSGGSSARAVQEDGPLSVLAVEDGGVGRYDESVELGLGTDDVLADAAGWRLHMGTWDEARIPAITIDLAASPHLIPIMCMLEVGDRIIVTGTPAWLPPGPWDLSYQGMGEPIGPFEWAMTLNTTPGGIWETGFVDDDTWADTDGSLLLLAAAPAATELHVAALTGPSWTSSNTNLIANSSFETNLTGWTANGVTASRDGSQTPMPEASLSSAKLIPDGVTVFPNLASNQVAVVAGTTYRISGWVRCAVARNIDVNINWYTSGHVYSSTSSVVVAVAANTWTRVVGTKVAPGPAAFASAAPTIANTPPNTHITWVDDIRLSTVVVTTDLPFDLVISGEVVTVTDIADSTSPQAMTVTRGVNGISKTLPVLSDVRLAHTPTVSY